MGQSQATGIGERLALLDARVRALQENTEREHAAALEGHARLEAAQAAIAKAVAEQATAHAVLSQWMRDWAAEITKWRTGVDRRLQDAEARQEGLSQSADQARGALRVAVWVFGAAATLATGILSGVTVRALGDWVARLGH